MLLYSIIGLFVLGYLPIAVIMLARIATSLRRIPVDAVIVGHEKHAGSETTVYFPIVEFVDHNGKTQTATVDGSSSSIKAPIGTRLTGLRYDRDNPSDVRGSVRGLVLAFIISTIIWLGTTAGVYFVFKP